MTNFSCNFISGQKVKSTIYAKLEDDACPPSGTIGTFISLSKIFPEMAIVEWPEETVGKTKMGNTRWLYPVISLKPVE